ncbi:MAG: type IV toxin-antitoxin system AbiEi family antitoxin domain-containing protein [Trueperaceae bacterium]|nr:type IV toxin-antitoxin system AbiEi family antitoxin domain-containing protein [Trueperaceae bacterium]
MKHSPHSARSRILAYAHGQPEGTVIRSRALLGLGSRAAVDQALARLARSGELLRIGRGTYVRPVVGRFGPRAPSTEAVVRSLAANTGERIAPTPAAAANALGLTTQNPVQYVYLTTGRTRELELGGRTVRLRHAPPWLVGATETKAGQLLRAGAWLGRERAREALRPLVEGLRASDRAELQRVVGHAPTWLAAALLARESPRSGAVGRG